MCSNSVSCPLCCQTSFNSIEALRTSLIKAAKGPLVCPICNEILQGLDKLTIHLFSHTSIDHPTIVTSTSFSETIKAKEIDPSVIKVKSFGKEPNLEGEQNTPKNINQFDNQIQPMCDICELSFSSIELLQMHNNLIHRMPNAQITSGELLYQCHLCPKVFKMKGSLRIHLKVVHLLGISNNKKENSRLSICDKIRKKNFPINANVKESPTHETSQQLISTTPQGINVDNSLSDTSNGRKNSIENLKTSETTKIWDCDICSKSFTTKYFLKKHKRLHTGEMPYTCEICGKTFTFQQSYHKHLLYHSDEKPHVCQVCGRAFKELSTLHNHERIHSGEKPFKCETCGKCFRQRVSYLVHKRIHTGAMPYNCSECGKSFRYKVSQKTHKCTASQVQKSESNLSQTQTKSFSPYHLSNHSSNDILEKLLQSSSIIPESDRNDNDGTLTDSHSFSSITEDILSKTIDDIVAESCDKMGICANQTVDIPDSLKMNLNGERIPSPSDKFQNLCLYSPTNSTSFITNLDSINDDSFKQLFYEDDPL